ncbi:hypothetical protein AZE42_12899 [Rhizopogon vesiculosus]|uniref:Uncharacterized protein n=1 Tax=Rhizopogon vesiculosus TaxID=180088 RepID=A0A1J8QN78_9AGAM|nr:hypothetical protein AZE42_12899 [Rhizopogon vesiculosus]
MTILCIVLGILGADPNLEPEVLRFVLLREGARQHNIGKVYSGLLASRPSARHLVTAASVTLRW